MQFLADYGLFLLKTVTLSLAILLTLGGILSLALRNKDRTKERLEIKKVNDYYEEIVETLNAEILPKKEFKNFLKKHKKTAKKPAAKRIFVLSFDGDMKASEVYPLREEITAVLNVATPKDEILVKLDSGGGLVHTYGLAASQLERIKSRKIPLTVAVDEIAASGGYLMACVANTILAAPFAIIGSIGVVAQLPNFHRLLKEHKVDFELITAGEYKRTLTLFGENTAQGREKFQQELEEIHQQFKDFVKTHRPTVQIDQIATGEHWLAQKAFDFGLVDKLITSDDYLLQASKHTDIYEIRYTVKLTLAEKLATAISTGVALLMNKFKANTPSHF